MAFTGRAAVAGVIGITIRDAIKEDILALYSGQAYLPERLIQEKLKFSDITIRPELL